MPKSPSDTYLITIIANTTNYYNQNKEDHKYIRNNLKNQGRSAVVTPVQIATITKRPDNIQNQSRAEAIIAYRETNGGFRKIEDLKKVDGIKEGIFQKIREQITVE